MGLFDKLKPQPRWKHADPAVRLDAVRELADPAELAILAETDPDARVRRAAICGTTDVTVLGRIAAGDADEEARDRATDRLLALATSAESDEATAVAATAAIADPRRLSAVARGDAPAAARADALARTTDERALGGIARHARHEDTALAALARLADAEELLDVAQHAESKDVALASFDRLASAGPDVELLKGIEARTQQKAVAKRARTLIQEIEAAEAARRAAEEERRRRETALCEAVEALAEVADPDAADAELGRLQEAWRALDVANPAVAARFEHGAAEARAAAARRRREAEEAAERARARAEALATRDAICVRVETLDGVEGDDLVAQLASLEEEWRSLTPLVGEGSEADRLAERFAGAVAACRKRHELGARLAGTRASLDALVSEAEGLLSQDDADAAARRWPALVREARGLTAVLEEASRPEPALAERLAAVDRGFAARDEARRAAEQQARAEALARLTRLAERAQRVAEAEMVTLREGNRLLRDIATGLEEAGKSQASRELEDAAARLRTLQERVAPRVHELREMDEWRRFANAQRQEQLIAMAEAVVASLRAEEEAGRESDLAATSRALRELHAKWHDVAEAPRQSAQRLWDRFRAATDFIRSRCEPYFAKLREERSANLTKKQAIVEEAEALAVSTDWAATAARLQVLQQEWQASGPVARETGRDLAHRFRTACNVFFARRREDLTARKQVWAENQARKEALCARAEALAESMEWAAASAEFKQMQAEWKTIGPVRRQKAEALWERFRAAANRFFDRFHHRHEIALAAKLAEREALVVELEGLAAAGGGEPPADLADRVQQLRATWSRSVPIPSADVQPILDRWQAALTAILDRWGAAFAGTEFDRGAVRQKLEKLVARVESLAASAGESTEGRSQAEVLAARLRSALATNAMGGRSHEDAKWRAAADAVKDAQSAWQRLAPIAGAAARDLDARFHDACRRVTLRARRAAPPRSRQKPTAAAV